MGAFCCKNKKREIRTKLMTTPCHVNGWDVTIKGRTGPGGKKRNFNANSCKNTGSNLCVIYFATNVKWPDEMYTISTKCESMPRGGSLAGPLGVTCRVSTNNHRASRAREQT